MKTTGDCGFCGRVVATRWRGGEDGQSVLYPHRPPRGSTRGGVVDKQGVTWCYGGGEPPAAKIAGDCPECGRTGVKLRTTKGRGMVGGLRHHNTPPPRSKICHYVGYPVGHPKAPKPLTVRRLIEQFDRVVAGQPTVNGHPEDNLGFAGTGGYFGPDTRTDEEKAAAVELRRRKDELGLWWAETADTEIDMVVSKAIEYGATDLRDLGRQIYEMAGRPQPDDQTATEAGIAFYVHGKMARVTAAIREGRQPSLDTWVDIGVYARMAQRVHEVGGWPGV